MLKKIAIILASIILFVCVMNTTNLFAATSEYRVEFIGEQESSYGYYPFSLYRDSSTYCWMCNDGQSEWPADYIFEFYVPGSYNLDEGRLKITGVNSAGDCYIRGSVAARIYSDDTIRACIGYNWAFICAGFPRLYDVAIWID